MILSKLLAATVAGGVVGAGTLALTPSLAASGDDPGSSQSARQQDGQRKDGKHHRGLVRARHLLHAQWTTANDVDHRAIRGTVTAVSAHAISVQAKDDVKQTYVVTGTTKVRVRDGEKGLDSISEVKVGDRALVVGTGPRDAVRIHAGTPKKASPSD